MDKEQLDFFNKFYDCVNSTFTRNNKQVDQVDNKKLLDTERRKHPIGYSKSAIKKNEKYSTDFTDDVDAAAKLSKNNSSIESSKKLSEGKPKDPYGKYDESLAGAFGQQKLVMKGKKTATLQTYEFKYSETEPKLPIRSNWCTPNCDCDMCRRVSYGDRRRCDHLIYHHDDDEDPPNFRYA